MTTATVHSPTAAMTVTTASTVTSPDGTRLAYRQFGSGPGLVLVHGAMESALSHQQLAEALADRFTVTLYDRRGRGASGPSGADYSVRKEVEDLAALLQETGARFVFGVSAGGVIALEAALALPALQRVAVYEPALRINGFPATDFLARYDQELAQGRVAAALVTGMQGARLGPAFFNALPRWLMEALTARMLAAEDQSAAPGQVTMRQLAPTLRQDFQLIAATDGALARYAGLRAQVLLLGGSASPAWLTAGVAALSQALPQAQRITFPGLGHEASGNRNQRGHPQRVAAALRRFFA
jgi:pimeloyl-ACP methyl ester carboxylesterase